MKMYKNGKLTFEIEDIVIVFLILTIFVGSLIAYGMYLGLIKE
jgi:hypothetical protein